MNGKLIKKIRKFLLQLVKIEIIVCCDKNKVRQIETQPKMLQNTLINRALKTDIKRRMFI